MEQNITRGPVGLYHSPGFCHIYSFINLWPKDVTCQILMHSDQWFMGKKMFQVLCYINLYKYVSPLRAWSFMTPEALFEQTW